MSADREAAGRIALKLAVLICGILWATVLLWPTSPPVSHPYQRQINCGVVGRGFPMCPDYENINGRNT